MIDWPAKSPAEVADYAFAWALALQDSETVVTRAVVADGVTVNSSAIEGGNTVRVWLSGGAEGAVATVTCTITTSGGRTFDEIAVLPIGQSAITLADAKRHLRVEDDTEDTVIQIYLDAACDHIERATGKMLRPTLVNQAAAAFPANGRIKLFRGPAREIVAIEYDPDDGSAAAELTDYRLSEGDPAVLSPLVGESFPSALGEAASVRIRYLAGYAPGEMPAALKSAVLLMLGHLFNSREAVVVGTIASELPLGVAALIAPHRAIGL